MSPASLTADHMEAVMRDYYDGCNEADAAKMMRSFTPDGTHYFQPGMYDGPFRDAAKTRTCSAVGAGVAQRWQAAVAAFGSYWTIDRLVIDAPQAPNTERLALRGCDYAGRGYALVSPGAR